MTTAQILPPEPSEPQRGGYKVDVTRGQHVDRVSSEWFSRTTSATCR